MKKFLLQKQFQRIITLRRCQFFQDQLFFLRQIQNSFFRKKRLKIKNPRTKSKYFYVILLLLKYKYICRKLVKTFKISFIKHLNYKFNTFFRYIVKRYVKKKIYIAPLLFGEKLILKTQKKVKLKKNFNFKRKFSTQPLKIDYYYYKMHLFSIYTYVYFLNLYRLIIQKKGNPIFLSLPSKYEFFCVIIEFNIQFTKRIFYYKGNRYYVYSVLPIFFYKLRIILLYYDTNKISLNFPLTAPGKVIFPKYHNLTTLINTYLELNHIYILRNVYIKLLTESHQLRWYKSQLNIKNKIKLIFLKKHVLKKKIIFKFKIFLNLNRKFSSPRKQPLKKNKYFLTIIFIFLFIVYENFYLLVVQKQANFIHFPLPNINKSLYIFEENANIKIRFIKRIIYYEGVQHYVYTMPLFFFIKVNERFFFLEKKKSLKNLPNLYIFYRHPSLITLFNLFLELNEKEKQIVSLQTTLRIKKEKKIKLALMKKRIGFFFRLTLFRNFYLLIVQKQAKYVLFPLLSANKLFCVIEDNKKNNICFKTRIINYENIDFYIYTTPSIFFFKIKQILYFFKTYKKSYNFLPLKKVIFPKYYDLTKLVRAYLELNNLKMPQNLYIVNLKDNMIMRGLKNKLYKKIKLSYWRKFHYLKFRKLNTINFFWKKNQTFQKKLFFSENFKNFSMLQDWVFLLMYSCLTRNIERLRNYIRYFIDHSYLQGKRLLFFWNLLLAYNDNFNFLKRRRIHRIGVIDKHRRTKTLNFEFGPCKISSFYNANAICYKKVHVASFFGAFSIRFWFYFK